MTKPRTKKPAKLGRATWDSPTVSATIIVGQNKGKLPPNRKGYCEARPAKFTTTEVESVVRSIRELQLRAQYPQASQKEISRMYSASSSSQKGWYQGDPEKSVAITFHAEGGDPADFRARMQHLADDVSSALCQDSVLVSFDIPGQRGAEGRSTAEDPTPEDLKSRRNIQARFTRRRR